MKKLKLMLKSAYSIDAIFELRKTPIIISLIFGIFLSKNYDLKSLDFIRTF